MTQLKHYDSRKQVKAKSTLRVVEPRDEYGSLLVEVTVVSGKKTETSRYAIDSLGGNDLTGETFIFTKMGTDAEHRYALHVFNGQDHVCECEAHQRGYLCRHFRMAKALRERGSI